MALMDSISANDDLYKQQPQQNQYLNGNPATDNNAQTNWMNPSQPQSSNNSNVSQSQPNPPSQVSNGTLLGSIAAGNVGQYMPGGYDQNKWNDPNKHDPKYDVGRILSKYPPSPEGLQSAAPELQQLGYKVVGKDKIQGTGGDLIDVGYAFGDPNANRSWYWSGDLNAGNPQANQSMLGNQQQPNQNTLQNLIWQVLGNAGQIPGTQNQFWQQLQQTPIPQVDINSLIGQPPINQQLPMTGGGIGNNTGLNPDVLARMRY